MAKFKNDIAELWRCFKRVLLPCSKFLFPIPFSITTDPTFFLSLISIEIIYLLPFLKLINELKSPVKQKDLWYQYLK